MTLKQKAVKVLSLVAIAIFLFILAIGCTTKPTETPITVPLTGLTELTATPLPTPEAIIPNTIITLPDGSQIILKPDTRIEILQQPGIPLESKEIVVKLLQGEIMVVPNLADGAWFSVQNPKGYTTRTQGCAMLVSLDDSANTFELQCIGGKCEIGLTPGSLIGATAGLTWTYLSDILMEPVAIDFAKIHTDFDPNLPACFSIAESQPIIPESGGEAGTPEPDIAATATAACSVFQQQFPSTPCP
jgi:hypothetical protein